MAPHCLLSRTSILAHRDLEVELLVGRPVLEVVAVGVAADPGELDVGVDLHFDGP